MIHFRLQSYTFSPDSPAASRIILAQVAQASEAAEKGPPPFCHSERSEESLFLFMELNRREILRFAQNDKINYFFRSLFSLSHLGPRLEAEKRQAKARPAQEQ